MADSYLLEAKLKVDEALAIYNAGLKPEEEIHKALTDASDVACTALKRLCNDEEKWKPKQPEKSTFLIGVFEIIKLKSGQKQPHFDEILLPVTVEALLSFGFKPPEEAKCIVSTARNACESLNSDSNPLILAIQARKAVEKLRDATCGTAFQLAKKMRSRETRKKWRQRAAKLLIWVSATLGTASIGEAVKPIIGQFSAPGKSAIETVEKQGLHDLATKGVKQAEENVREAQQDSDDGENGD